MLGFPILGVEWQKMENPDLRTAMGMQPDQKGVRIRRVDPTAPESTVLKSSDIMLSFDGVDIANDGTGKVLFIYAYIHMHSLLPRSAMCSPVEIFMHILLTWLL